jgi:chitinase
MIIALKTKIRSKLLVVSPECVTVYEGVSVPSPDIGGQAWNYFVPIIKAADSSIDLYQVQAYNNWYGGIPGGSFNYLKEVYLNWRNLPSGIPWSSAIPDFSGVNPNKLLMGVLASTSAGISNYYAPPNVIQEFKSWLKTNSYPLKGFMMWDSNWDRLNNFQISNAITDPLP